MHRKEGGGGGEKESRKRLETSDMTVKRVEVRETERGRDRK